MPRALLLATATIAVLVLTGCSVGDDGPRTTQTRDVAAFTRIDNRGSVDVRLRVGEQQRVEVRAGEKVIDDVRTEVRDGTLELTFDHDGFGGDDVVVDVSVPKLAGIEVSGSGDVDGDGLDADAFELVSEGSADIALEGAVGRLAVVLDGSGRRGSRPPVVARGARGRERLGRRRRARRPSGSTSTSTGPATCSYYGDPVVTQRVDGSGDLTHAD